MSQTFAPTTQHLPLLRPIIALNCWTFFMEAWMYKTRIPALSKYNVPIGPNYSKADFNAKIPPHIQWKADNYNHLQEQPTQFYAVALSLAFLGAGQDRLSVGLAWSYVGLRIVHSLVQCLGNNIMARLGVFVASSSVLLGMTVRAGLVVFGF